MSTESLRYAVKRLFFVVLVQAYKLLAYIDRHQSFSELSVRALRYIKYCAYSMSILIVMGIIISVALFYGNEDITGIIMLALIYIFTSSVIATFAAVLQRLLQATIDIKTENDLTV